ncbi:hypothetical protein TPA0906_70630 [Streptomyces olivaceus]|nr:hypothetical protein TPA0906_70630 [Streptomyces olivaceus]
MEHRLGRDLGLVHRGHRARIPGQPAEDPAELGGVLRPGICTMVTRTPLRSWSSSQRSDSVNPWMACLAPQYTA